MKTRREKADKILEKVDDYLDKAGWFVDDVTLLRIDPITQSKYPGDTAFCIQLGRDLA